MLGGRLVRELVERGVRVRALARHPERLRDFPWADQIEIAAGDAGDPESLSQAMQGVSVAYYLLHSLQEGHNLEREERRIAENFAQCAAQADLSRIVYLGVDSRPTCPQKKCPPTCAPGSRSGKSCTTLVYQRSSYVLRSLLDLVRLPSKCCATSRSDSRP